MLIESFFRLKFEQLVDVNCLWLIRIIKEQLLQQLVTAEPYAVVVLKFVATHPSKCLNAFLLA